MSAIKFNFNMSFSDIDRGIGSIKNRSAKIRMDIHKMNVSVLARWLETGDVRQPVAYATKIVNEMEYHAQAVADWFTFYAGFQWDADKKVFTATETTITKEKVLEAKAQSFEELSPPKPVKALDILAKLNTLITQGNNRLAAKADKRSPEDALDGEEMAILAEAAQRIVDHRNGRVETPEENKPTDEQLNALKEKLTTA